MSLPNENFGRSYDQDFCRNYASENNDSGPYFVNPNYNFGSSPQQQGSLSASFSSSNVLPNSYNVPLQFTVPPPQCPQDVKPFEEVKLSSIYSTPSTMPYVQHHTAFERDFTYQHMPPQKSFIQYLHYPQQKAISFTNEISDSTKENNNWITKWLKSIGKLEKNDVSNKKDCDNLPGVKIYEMKEKIVEMTKLLTKLETLSKSLSITYKSLNEEQWLLRCHEIEDTKKMLTNLLGCLSNNKELLLKVKQKLNKRKKKRERQKRKREEYKSDKLVVKIKQQKLHNSIDQWLEDMKESVERGRRDEEIKREADSVLAEVTRKKTEGRRQISLLSALLKLRQARVTSHLAIGINVSHQQTEAFNCVIERLKSLWTLQLDGYLKEELALKVMLNEAVAEEKNSETLKRKQNILEWESLLFGSKSKSSLYQPSDIEGLVDVRKQWDQFVVDEGTIMSSSIPPGWVVPVKASNDDWAKYEGQK